MAMYKSIREISEETGISASTIRQWCREGKLRYNIAGATKYILRMDWVEEDLTKMAATHMISKKQKLHEYGKLRMIKEK